MAKMRDDAISIVKQELYCHSCDKHVQFEGDLCLIERSI